MSTENAFLALLRAGLWERDIDLPSYELESFDAVYKLAEKQTVVGLVAAGIEHLKDIKPSQAAVLPFLTQVIYLEQRNTSMNVFIAETVIKMRNAGIFSLLVKGQGVAQCYERPLWRSSGDVDFFLDESNYYKSITFFRPLASGSKQQERYSRHWGINIDSWYVEVHGSLRTGLSTAIDKEVDAVQEDSFRLGNVRAWRNGNTDVFLPGVDNDVFFVFTHFIKHLYKEGMTLRQVCDWCRLMWTFRDKLNVTLLEKRLRRAGLMGEWKAFSAMAVAHLGMSADAMPLYDSANKWQKKGDALLNFILLGSHGKVRDTWRLMKIFPLHTIHFLPSIYLNVNWLKIKERLLGN